MLDFITKFFRKDESSRSVARERLRLVLMSDRVALAPETFDAMKGEMLGVLQRYLEIDEQGLDVHFENAERRFMLLANIPVMQVKSREQIEQERRAMAVNGNGAAIGETRTVRRRRRRRRAAASNPAEVADSAALGEHAQANGAAGNGAVNSALNETEQPESQSDLPNPDQNQET